MYQLLQGILEYEIPFGVTVTWSFLELRQTYTRVRTRTTVSSLNCHPVMCLNSLLKGRDYRFAHQVFLQFVLSARPQPEESVGD
jgi:hypothetical protein